METVKDLLNRYKVDIIFVALTSALLFYLSTSYTVLYVTGSSMMPTYDNNDVLILSNSNKSARGEIIVFEAPNSWGNRSHLYVKRLIGKGGDILKIKNGSVFINTSEVVSELEICESVEMLIPENKVFVMGDNHGNSNDSYGQYCAGHKEFLVNTKDVVSQGKEVFKFGGRQ